MTMPEQLYLPQQLVADDFEIEDAVAPRQGASWPRRLLAKLIVFRTRQAHAFLESRGYIRDNASGELYRPGLLRRP